MAGIKDVRNKGVKVELGGAERTLKLDLNAYAELEEAYGSIEEAMKHVEKGSIKAIRKLLWAGLIHEDPKLTEIEVGAMLCIEDLPSLTDAIESTMLDSLPEETKKALPNVEVVAGRVDPK